MSPIRAAADLPAVPADLTAVGGGDMPAPRDLINSLRNRRTPNDAATFAAVSLVLAVVALIATYLPARRAAEVMPTEALRGE